jgi:hypothetical protein
MWYLNGEEFPLLQIQLNRLIDEIEANSTNTIEKIDKNTLPSNSKNLGGYHGCTTISISVIKVHGYGSHRS